jgi:hypothetical protein
VVWLFSSLRKTGTPTLAERLSERFNGVRRTRFCKRDRAVRMSL